VTTPNFNAGAFSEDAIVSVISSSRRAANIKSKKEMKSQTKFCLWSTYRLVWWYRELEYVAVEKPSKCAGRGM
jgi:hypothetical protein